MSIRCHGQIHLPKLSSIPNLTLTEKLLMPEGSPRGLLSSLGGESGILSPIWLQMAGLILSRAEM